MIHGENSYGSEFARTPDRGWIVCPICKGKGYLADNAKWGDCAACNGEGRILEAE